MVALSLGDAQESRRVAAELSRRSPNNRVAARIVEQFGSVDTLSGAER
jgi:hypothetical protein